MPVICCEPQRAMLLLVDMQPAFLHHARPGAGPIVENANVAIRYARALGVPVAAVRTVHQRDGSSWTLNMLEDREGFALAGDADAEFASGLDLDLSVIPLVKTRDSAFYGTNLDALLFQMGTVELLLAGVMASSCIMHTARDAYERSLKVTLLADAIGDVSLRRRDESLEDLERDLRQTRKGSTQLLRGLQAFDIPTLIGH